VEFSQVWLAEQVSQLTRKPLTQPTVHRWLKEGVVPRGENLAALASLLGSSEAWLVYGSAGGAHPPAWLVASDEAAAEIPDSARKALKAGAARDAAAVAAPRDSGAGRRRKGRA
jgi:hypothetical protein